MVRTLLPMAGPDVIAVCMNLCVFLGLRVFFPYKTIYREQFEYMVELKVLPAAPLVILRRCAV